MLTLQLSLLRKPNQSIKNTCIYRNIKFYGHNTVHYCDTCCISHDLPPPLKWDYEVEKIITQSREHTRTSAKIFYLIYIVQINNRIFQVIILTFTLI